MKVYELSALPDKLPTDILFLVRLDGNCFTNYTKLFPQTKENPFNRVFTHLMYKTAKALLNDQTFKPVLAYTHSDEITLVFNGSDAYNNRLQKLISLLAAKATGYFHNYFHQNKSIKSFPEENILKLSKMNPVFDARIIYFGKGNDSEIINYFLHRSQHDCYRNCISKYFRMYFGSKGKVNLTAKEAIMHNFYVASYDDLYSSEKLSRLKELGIEETDIPIYLRYGHFLKKIRVKKVMDDPMNPGTEIEVTRTKTISWSMKFGYDVKLFDLFTDKYFDQDIWSKLDLKESVLYPIQ